MGEAHLSDGEAMNFLQQQLRVSFDEAEHSSDDEFLFNRPPAHKFCWNYLLCPCGAILPPLVLLVMWAVEAVLVCVLVVVLLCCAQGFVYHELKVRCSIHWSLTIIISPLLVFLSFPFFVVLFIFLWISSILHSLFVACNFYIAVILGKRGWMDVEVICSQSFSFIERLEILDD